MPGTPTPYSRLLKSLLELNSRLQSEYNYARQYLSENTHLINAYEQAETNLDFILTEFSTEGYELNEAPEEVQNELVQIHAKLKTIHHLVGKDTDKPDSIPLEIALELEEIHEENADYLRLYKILHQLCQDQDKETLYLEIKPKLQELLKNIKMSYEYDLVPLHELVKILTATYDLLHDQANGMSPAQYHSLANTMQGSPSRMMQWLGGLMIGLALLLSMTPVNLLVSIDFTIAGLGFFAIGSQRRGLSKIMCSIEEAVQVSTLQLA